MKTFDREYYVLREKIMDYVEYEVENEEDYARVLEMFLEAKETAFRQIDNTRVQTNRWYANECRAKLLWEDLKRYRDKIDLACYANQQHVFNREVPWYYKGHMKSSPFLIVGPHRSGTSITTRVMQRVLTRQNSDELSFPFEVTRHAEPVELMEIEKRFMERNGLEFIDRLYFPQLQPDMQFLTELMDFFNKYKDTVCAIKSPVMSIYFHWLQLPRMFRTIFVTRSSDDMARSLIHHKKMRSEDAYASAQWYYTNVHQLMQDPSFLHFPRVHFGKDKSAFKTDLMACAEFYKFPFYDQYFDLEWDEHNIEPYARGNNAITASTTG